MNVDVIVTDDEPMLELEYRPRSRTWPILPPPIETIHEHECDAEIAEPPPIIEEAEPEIQSNEQQRSEPNPRKSSRKNAWGNLSYADLITQAIQGSPEQRLTLSQIYEWMVRTIPYFKDKGDSTSSAGWKNSIRHNLSLHSRFMRVQNDNNGKSSYWVINPDAKPGKSSRRRSGSVDGQPKSDKKRMRNKKLNQSTDDISALSPNSMKFKRNRSYDNLFSVSSPCSSTDSLSNLDDYHPDVIYSPPHTGESFGRPRSTSNVSQQGSINGRLSPIQADIEADISRLEESRLTVPSLGAEETANMVESMSIESNQVSSLGNTINLDDSLKLMKTEPKFGGVNELSVRRPHSNSFGSGDSGYESPVYISTPKQGQVANANLNRTMSKMPSPNSIVPNKPPPPYNQAFQQQLRQQQPMFNRQEFYPQQQQNGINYMSSAATVTNSVPRLKHLPYSQPRCSFPAQQQQSSQLFNQQRNNRYGVENGMNVFDSYIGRNVVAPNITINSKTDNSMQFRKPQYDFMDGIPSDLHRVKLNDFDDQQQLASDLDAIIRNDLEESSSNFQTIYEPFNNNMPSNTQTVNFSVTGQSWVR